MNISHVQRLFAHGILFMGHTVGLRAPWTTLGNDGLVICKLAECTQIICI